MWSLLPCYVREAIEGFLAQDLDSNFLLGADTSNLIVFSEINPDGVTATLLLDGSVVLFPNTADEVVTPANALPYNNVAMVQIDGEWRICPQELISAE